MVLLDIDQLPELMGVSPLASYNRWNVASYDERDHFGDPALPLRERLRRDAAAQGLDLPAGSIFLLTHLRYFGRCRQLADGARRSKQHVWRFRKLLVAPRQRPARRPFTSLLRDQEDARLALHGHEDGLHVRLYATQHGQIRRAHGEQRKRKQLFRRNIER